MHKLLISLLFIITFQTCLVAQDSIRRQEQNKYNFSQLVNEAGLLVIRPIKWNGCDWIKFGVVGVTTVALMQEDKKIRDFSQNNQKYPMNFLMEVGNQY